MISKVVLRCSANVFMKLSFALVRRFYGGEISST